MTAREAESDAIGSARRSQIRHIGHVHQPEAAPEARVLLVADVAAFASRLPVSPPGASRRLSNTLRSEGTRASAAVDRTPSETKEGVRTAHSEEHRMEQQIIEAAALDGRRTGPAVFAVEHTSGKRLILSSRCLSKRISDQRRYLDEHDHHNPGVQADLAVDGPAAFRLVVLELLDDPSMLAPMKRLHIEHARRSPYGCYNSNPPPAQRQLSLDAGAAAAVARLVAPATRLTG